MNRVTRGVVIGGYRFIRVAGDFFLEPDDAILALDAALEGAPAHTDTAGLAARPVRRPGPGSCVNAL